MDFMHDQRADDYLAATGVRLQIGNEAAVDLDTVEGQLARVAQSRVAATAIIER